ncbi:MAG: hypothetical protein H6577_22045 [Lewinellaceae bacterium]|nr:hypothetical protein [Saprospiraceae bacterium]MCB9340816.1 hypothetical protein [Lewinellaceae bacterium]
MDSKKNYTGNTNKWRMKAMLLLCTFAFFQTSCDLFKPAQDSDKEKVYKDEDLGEIQGTKVFDPETGTWRTVREVNGPVDTIQWTTLPADRFPPIQSDGSWSGVGNNGTGPNDTGNTTGSGVKHSVAVVLPFLANKGGTTIDDNSLWAINFYAGAKLAFENLASQGVSLDVSVMDSEASTSKVDNILKGVDMQKADLVIGAYKRDNVETLADFAKQNKKPFVVPYTAQMGMATDNPNYIQVNPSLKSHCEAITRHARKKYLTSDIVLVVQNKPEEKERLKYFQQANAVIEGSATASKFRELIVPPNSRDINVRSYLKTGRTTVFIVPSWADESFVYSLLRQLMMVHSEGEDIVVYGMPQWKDYNQVDFEFYEKLNVHISSAFYVDYADERVKQFRQKYFDTFGTVPSEEAFLGYDIMLYFGKMVDKYGKDLAQRIDRDDYDVLHGRFNFERVVLNPEQHKEQSGYFDQLENVYVNILRFQDFQFRPAE